MKKIAALALILAGAAFVGCYPYTPAPCAVGDTSCLPCADTRSTASWCFSPLTDLKSPDGGAADAGGDSGTR